MKLVKRGKHRYATELPRGKTPERDWSKANTSPTKGRVRWHPDGENMRAVEFAVEIAQIKHKKPGRRLRQWLERYS